jgi:predicted amidophosphoribosyltransferase
VPTVAELTALYANFMFGPRQGPEVCDVCFNFTDGYSRCYACAHGALWLDAVAPISYSVAREQLHHALKGYKRLSGDVGRRLAVELAAVLWRFLDLHEPCVCARAGVERFDVVCTVPSGDRGRDVDHPLRWIVGEVIAPTRGRHLRALLRSEATVPAREFDPSKYEVVGDVEGRSVLLIDDTWTTGANAQSAAAALKTAGAPAVGAVVIGRHLNREWHENDERLHGIAHPFDWRHCALCGPAGGIPPDEIGTPRP